MGTVRIVTKQLAVVQDDDGLHVLYGKVLKVPHIAGVYSCRLGAAIRTFNLWQLGFHMQIDGIVNNFCRLQREIPV